jgi:hypothetical protein
MNKENSAPSTTINKRMVKQPKRKVPSPTKKKLPSTDYEAQKKFVRFCNLFKNKIGVAKSWERQIFIKPLPSEKTAIIYKSETTLDQLLHFKHIKFHPEAISFLYHLEGVSKKLLLFIIGFLLDPENNEFLWNPTTKEQFIAYCNLFGDKYTPTTIDSAIKTLGKSNCVISLRRTKYMLNPLIITDKATRSRNFILAKYNLQIFNKGLDQNANYYPKYEK